MTAKLRKRPGTHTDLGLYELSGSLAGLSGPGRRTVIELELRRLDGDDLSVLESFADLKSLRIERSQNLDLSTLPELPGLELTLDRVSGVDLSALDGRNDLESLWFLHMGEARTPPRLRLSSRLHRLLIYADGTQSGLALELVEAIDWESLTQLRNLGLRVHADRLLRTDLSFIGSLQQLKRLEILGDLRHEGTTPSPFAPPFPGLPKDLKALRIRAYGAARLKRQIQQHMGLPEDPTGEPSVTERYRWEPGLPMWEPIKSGIGWEASGHLAVAAADPDRPEADMRKDAAQQLARFDPELASRVEIDPLRQGSALVAETQKDLLTALQALNLTVGWTDYEPQYEPDEPTSGLGRWALLELDDGWSVYGSFADFFDDDAIDEEYEAVRKAQRIVKHQNRALADRLTFDHESDGTGVYADAREDLEAMLEILDIR